MAAKRPRAEIDPASEPALLQRSWTVSIALPGSIVYNAQSRELQTHLAGQIARVACIFQVDEIVIYDDGHSARGKFEANRFLAKLLQYTETPQYLRKHLFPRDPDLKLAGLLPPLDAPHHLRAEEWFSHREGVVLDRPGGKDGGSIVDIGLMKACALKQTLVPGARVTVQLTSPRPSGMREVHTAGLSTAAQEQAAASSTDPQAIRKHSACALPRLLRKYKHAEHTPCVCRFQGRGCLPALAR
jgi:predicted SPOUT superfamily RNA methylase MTH1